MNFKKGTFFLLLLMVAFVCSSFTSCQNTLKTQLLGCWTHAYEENTGTKEEKIFRPCDYKAFPPSRFRFSLELKEDGVCSYLELAPNDAHAMTDGIWHLVAKTNTIEVWSQENVKIASYTILEIKEDLLTLKQL